MNANKECTEISIFQNQPPAHPQYVAEVVATLALAFPQMPKQFWSIVADEINSENLSAQRLNFIKKKLLHSHTYPTITLAEIINTDRKIKIYSLNEYYKLHNTTDIIAGWCKLKQRDAAGHTQFCTLQDAIDAGLEIETNATMNNVSANLG